MVTMLILQKIDPVNFCDSDEGLGTRIWNATLGNARIQGGFKMLGGVGEMLVGSVLCVVPAPPTKVGGWVLIGHGADVVAAGWRQMWSGESVSSFTAQAVSRGLQSAGIDPVGRVENR